MKKPDRVIYDPSRRFVTPQMLPEKGISFHPNHLRRMWQEGKFPKPVRISPHRIAWPEEVIDQWMAEKIAGPNTEAA
jgi:prophage regulatory protein